MINNEYTEELELIATLAEEFGESVAEQIVDGLLFGTGAALHTEYFHH